MVLLIAQPFETSDAGLIIWRSRCTKQTNTSSSCHLVQPSAQQQLQMPTPPLGAYNAYLEICRQASFRIHLGEQRRQILLCTLLGNIQHRNGNQLIPHPCAQAQMRSMQTTLPHLHVVASEQIRTFQCGHNLCLQVQYLIQVIWSATAKKKSFFHNNYSCLLK